MCTYIDKICNVSNKRATFPDKCKVTKIKPLYKKGLKSDSKNFRPISLLPLISEIIVRIIHNQTISYTNINQVLDNFTQQGLVGHTSMTKWQKLSILVSWPEWFLLIYKRRSIQLTTTFSLKNALSGFYWWDNQVVYIISLK